MELSYPAIEGINIPKKYTGPITVLAFLDVSVSGYLSKYPCGHRTARKILFRSPKVLLQALRNRGKLADLPLYDEVIVFDLERLYHGLYGHRETELCPACFFDRLLNELDPVCPYCKRRIHNGERVWLVRYGELNLDQRHLIKVVKIKHDGFSWAMCCCSKAEKTVEYPLSYIWNAHTRELEKR